METNEQRIPDIRAFLDIRGFSGSIEDFNSYMGMLPDEAWLQGDIIPAEDYAPAVYRRKNEPLRRQYSCWTIKADLAEPSYVINDYIRDIRQKALHLIEKIKKLPPSVNIMVCVWVDMYFDSTPAFSLDNASLRFLSEINADLDVDISCFPLD